jgi:L-ribulose-5-phosphate 4-epimerase
MLEALKKAVCDANLDLVARGLVVQTFGNVSGIDRESALVVIKPSGVDYSLMRPEHMVVISLETGNVVEGELNPSSDAPTHLVLYRAFESIGAVVHTHSFHATSWAQARCEIPALGTTHADYSLGSIPCTRTMTDQEIQDNYEANTGHVITERFSELAPDSCPFVLVASHGPFVWGATLSKAVENAEALEYLAMLASQTLRIRPNINSMQTALLRKHFFRKHGGDAYYGQR